MLYLLSFEVCFIADINKKLENCCKIIYLLLLGAPTPNVCSLGRSLKGPGGLAVASVAPSPGAPR